MIMPRQGSQPLTQHRKKTTQRMTDKEESTGENEKEEIDGKGKATITDKKPESTQESSTKEEPQSPKKDASTDPIEESGD